MSAGAPEILTAPYYERLDELERRHWWCRSVRRVGLDLVARRLSENATVLDAGCGAGGLLEQIARRWPRAQSIGTDISHDALRFARAKAIRDLLFASVVRLPVAGGRVDVLFSNDVLQHLPDGEDARALAEARRVLKPGGLLCVRSNFGRASETDASSAPSRPSLHRRYSRRRLAALVRDAGFTIERHVVLHALPASLPRRKPRHDTGGAPSGGLVTTVPPAPINALLDLYVRVEDRLAMLLPFPLPWGDAQILLARRGQ